MKTATQLKIKKSKWNFLMIPFILFMIFFSNNLFAQPLILGTLVSPNEVSNGFFGFSVNGLGDLNGDGYADVIVGARETVLGLGTAGRAYVFSGGGAGAGTVLYTLVSPNASAAGYFGESVGKAGDINKDGFMDIIVGAPGEDLAGGKSGAGRVYIFSGNGGGLLYTFVSPNAESGGNFGQSVAAAGDVNNDTYPDIIIGANENHGSGPANAKRGRAYIYSGNGGGLLYTLISPNAEGYGYFGSAGSGSSSAAVMGIGDINKDGYADVSVGARGETVGGISAAGRAYIFSGNGGGLLYTFISPNPVANTYFGNVVNTAGDINNDTYPDMIIPGDGETVGAFTTAGRAYVFSGNGGGLLYSFISPNVQTDGRFGWSAANAGDMNNDTRPDIIVGAQKETVGGTIATGRAYVFSGIDGSLLYTFISANPETSGRFGKSVAAAGDYDNDGNLDIIIGADFENPGTSPLNAGRA